MRRRLFGWMRLRTAEFWRQIVALGLGLLAGVKAIVSFQSGLHFWQVASLLVLAFLTFGAGKLAWTDERKRAALLIRSREDLIDENVRWLSEPGQVVVVTRSMSWAVDTRLESLLAEKAKSADLTIIAAKRTAQLTRLRRKGATVILRSNVPTVRFTALRFGAADCTVLVHYQKSGLIHFRQYTRVDFPIYWLCQDLIISYLADPDPGEAGRSVGSSKDPPA